MAEISDDDLGLLVACALDYDVRLPHRTVPMRVWEALSPQWRGRINEAKDSKTDEYGREVRRPLTEV
jgi:hypothetical protein